MTFDVYNSAKLRRNLPVIAWRRIWRGGVEWRNLTVTDGSNLDIYTKNPRLLAKAHPQIRRMNMHLLMDGFVVAGTTHS
jgi:hypothetical protein